jgi:uncharacterized protein YbcV (DUF1398 family)
MNTNWKDVARATMEGSEKDALTFPQGVKMLIETGFDGYAVDYRRNTRTYYLPDGQSEELKSAFALVPVAEHFDAAVVKEAIREAQQTVPGYTYEGFCAKVAKAGCAGYLVSFSGKRVLYYGRTGETHTEYFPGTQPDTEQ